MRASLAGAAFEAAVVARVLAKESREGKSMKEVAGNTVGKRDSIALAISRQALAEGGIVVLRLRYGGAESGTHKGNRLEAVADK